MTDVNQADQAVAALIHEESSALNRIGKDFPGYSCFFCGHHDENLGACNCPFPEAFKCSQLKSACPKCSDAHRKVAAHLETLFSAKLLRVHRADARRSRLFRFLRDALEALSDKGDVQAKNLRSRLGGHCDPRTDEPAEFRASVLEAFRRSAFFDFRGLAAAIDEEDKIFCALKLAEVPPEFWKQFGGL